MAKRSIIHDYYCRIWNGSDRGKKMGKNYKHSYSRKKVHIYRLATFGFSCFYWYDCKMTKTFYIAFQTQLVCKLHCLPKFSLHPILDFSVIPSFFSFIFFALVFSLLFHLFFSSEENKTLNWSNAAKQTIVILEFRYIKVLHWS